ncbi:MAG TPA: hypothetical protein VJS86_08840 [Arthrobacter sp.]|nr:hypothetical protein [Arthrobacter sp.]
MKTRAALALSVAGILVTGTAALAVNTQVLNTTPAGTGNANSVLLPNSPGKAPAPAAVGSAKATPAAASVAGSGTAPTVTNRASAPKPGDEPKPGDDKGGDRKDSRRTVMAEPGNGKGTKVAGHDDAGLAGSQPGGTAGSQSDARPAGSQPAGTAGSQSAAGDPAVVVQPPGDKGGLRTVPERGDDKGGLRKAPESGDDSGGHGSDD